MKNAKNIAGISIGGMKFISLSLEKVFQFSTLWWLQAQLQEMHENYAF